MKIPAIPALVVPCREFIREPDIVYEDAILRLFKQAVVDAGFEAPDDAFIEWGCVEHGVIHILAYEGQQWIEIDPATGAISLL